jgi:hypothetical protein
MDGIFRAASSIRRVKFLPRITGISSGETSRQDPSRTSISFDSQGNPHQGRTRCHGRACHSQTGLFHKVRRGRSAGLLACARDGAESVFALIIVARRSGETDTNGRILRWGDGLMRGYLFEAATVLRSYFSARGHQSARCHNSLFVA